MNTVIASLFWGPVIGALLALAANAMWKKYGRPRSIDFLGILDESPIAIYVVHEDRLIHANKALQKLLGYDDCREMVGRPASEFTYPDDIELFQDMHRKRFAGDVGTTTYSYMALCKDGRGIPITVTGGVVKYRGRSVLVGMAYDATIQWEAERKSNLANQVFNSAVEGIIITDSDFRIEAVNPAFTAITGYEPASSIGKISNLLRAKQRDPLLPERMKKMLIEEGHWEGEIEDRRKNGETYPAWISISTVYDHAHKPSNYVYVFTDNTRRKESESRLRELASRDSLTGLFNRATFVEELELRIVAAQARKHKLAVYFIDLDRFKCINDTMGHEVGDLLLKEIARRMRSVLRSQDIAARIGGDEFVVVFEDMQSADDAAHVARRLADSLNQPATINGHEIFVTTSIGWAISPEDGSSADELLRHADIAMYQAKAAGRDSCVPFANEMIGHAQRRVSIESKIHGAMARDEFSLVYQPQVASSTGKVVGVEALIRWTTSDGTVIPPSEFIPIAEANGQIVAIGTWVLRKACQQMRIWQSMGLKIPRVSVNLSPRQLLRPNLIASIESALKDNAIDPACLELEITEGVITDYTQEVIGILGQIRTLGVSLAIDDFGTGYSSLSVLKHAPVDRLKIDRSFVLGLPGNEDDAAITEAIIVIAQKLKLEVVGEGVETLEQLQFLQNAGCDVIQGYFTGRPMTATQLAKHLHELPPEYSLPASCNARLPYPLGHPFHRGGASDAAARPVN
jgi:diguanylate cyclase (GGDEF)-like protein/PAS domain S-box-containing protein